MKRLTSVLMIALCLVAADVSAQGNSSAGSGGDLYPSIATDQRAPLPRINPRELLPRNWFGSEPVETAPTNSATAPTSPAAQPAVAPTTNAAMGSAQARLMRDMRRSDAVAGAAADQRSPQPRAGSVLSSNAPKTGAESATVASKNARLARSIAAEAANAIAGPTIPSHASSPQTVATNAAPSLPNITPIESKPSTLPFGNDEDASPAVDAQLEPASPPTFDDGVTTHDAPGADHPFAESDSGRISVASKPQAETKLPMLIGDRYNKPSTRSTVGTTEPVAKTNLASGPKSIGARPLMADSGAKAEPAEDDLLLTQRMPVLVSKVAGPRTIIVGREATYRVLLANRGDVAAEQVVTNITVPDWAEVVAVKSADGKVERADTLGDPGAYVWRTNRLAAGGVVKLDLRLIARSGQPIELGVAHTHKPIDGHTLVEVQEPKLGLALVGPEEVLFGKPQSFRLTISNPGTGVAENVVLRLTPPGGDTSKQTSHDFGMIGAGEERTVEIELTAREAGQLAVNASANADGGVTADVTKEVFCRKPELVVDWRGPAERYAGAPGIYQFRVRNPGTAVAPDVVLDVELPPGFEVLAGAETPQAKSGRLAYRVGSLRPGDDRYFELRGVMRQAGTNQIQLSAAGSDETRSEAITAVTEVVALADLKLDIHDPKGPIATNQEVTYEVRITNRGSNNAHDVRVIGLFSEGIEPYHVDGGVSEIHDGRVAFESIDVIAAGEERVFTIHARAHVEGTHLFRAEVLCRDLEIKLAAEETTRFFEDEPIDVAGDGYPSSSGNPVFPR